jgi:hypothetical protein
VIKEMAVSRRLADGSPSGFALAFVCALALAHSLFAVAANGLSLKRATYHGWRDALILGNGQVEAVIVPSIGRVMQFRFAGEADGPFWENRALDGKPPDPRASEWVNFGGDKPWPAPQGDWPNITPRAWPPPVGFDASAWRGEPMIVNFSRAFPGSVPGGANVGGTVVKLTSPVDPHYGIRVVRLVQIDPAAPVMRIKTIYEKVSGEPRRVAVWVITQLKEPVGVFVPVPPDSRYVEGYNKQSEELPQGFRVERGPGGAMISLKRDPNKATKIGSDAGTLLWVGERQTLRIDSPRVADAEYPDNGSSAEVYTHPIPAHPYVELEMLGPLARLAVGDKIERTNVYTLARRRQSEGAAEARAVLAR